MNTILKVLFFVASFLFGYGLKVEVIFRRIMGG